MGTKQLTQSVTPFWYRRISEIIWLITLSLWVLWVLGTFVMPDDIALMELVVPLPALIGATAATLMTIVAYARPNAKSSDQLISLGYATILLTSLYTVISTGDVGSPFIALWLLVSIFAAIFGLSMLIPVAIATNVYLLYLYMYTDVSQSDLITYGIAFEIPLIVSFLIWRKGVQRADTTDRTDDTTFNALAKELSQVSNKSEIVINAIADGVVAIDGQGVVQLINPAAQRIIGWGKQDALRLDYRSVLQLFTAKNEEVAEGNDPIQKCLHTNETIETEDLQLATTSGKKLMLSLLVSPLGQIGSGAIIVFRDITAARAEERQQAEFISTASHEMRTPVAAIEGYIGLALNPQTATIDDKAKLYLSKAHESAQHLGRLFQDLLDISKADDGRLTNDPRVIDVISYVRDVTQSFNHMAATKGLILLYRPDTKNPSDAHVSPAFFVSADPDHIREVVGNLIENAIKYTKAGDVTVDVTGDDTRVEISISDTGIGIPQEDIGHLFQKFYRIDNTDTRVIGGTGLGLYLCRRLVETMGGRIWVTSTLGKGSTFHIELARMSNIEATKMIEAAVDQPGIGEFHATPSFLASEEEAAAVKQAATQASPLAQTAEPVPTPQVAQPTTAPAASSQPAAAAPAATAAPQVAPQPEPAATALAQPVAPSDPTRPATPTTPVAAATTPTPSTSIPVAPVPASIAEQIAAQPPAATTAPTTK